MGNKLFLVHLHQLGTADVKGPGNSWLWGLQPVHCRMQCSISGLHPRDASSSPDHDNQNVSRHSQMTQGAKSLLAENQRAEEIDAQGPSHQLHSVCPKNMSHVDLLSRDTTRPVQSSLFASQLKKLRPRGGKGLPASLWQSQAGI